MKKIIPMLSMAACLTSCHEIPKVEINENATAVLCFENNINSIHKGRESSTKTYYFDMNKDGLIDCIAQFEKGHDKNADKLIEYNFKKGQGYAFKDLSSYLKVIVMPQFQSKENGTQFVSLLDISKRDSSYDFTEYTALLDVPENNTTKRYLCKWESKSPESAAVCEALIYNMKNGAIYSKEAVDNSFTATTEIPRPKNNTTNSTLINNANKYTR